MEIPHVTVFDTTLRDGEQSPGCSMTANEKIRMARELEGLGVDVIEAGFAAASPDEVRAIRGIAEEVTGPVVAALARAASSDIDAAAKAVEKADRPRIHTFIATSDVHLEHKLAMSRDECLNRAAEAVRYARTFVEDVEFSAEDATRTDPAFLTAVVEAALEAGASTINVPDTVGYALPHEITRMISRLRKAVPGLSGAVLSVHCHDDLGLAVANSLAGIAAGARQVECTVNGIGERAGNASLEEIVMTLKVRADEGIGRTRVNTRRIHRASRMLSHITGVHPQPNKAIVGRNAFAHEAGIHQHGMLCNRKTYEIMTPEMVGAPASDLVLGKHSGRHGLEARYRRLGYELSPEELERVSADFQRLADRKREVLDEDLVAILHHTVMDRAPKHHRVRHLKVACGGDVSTAELEVMSEGGVPRVVSGKGDGPIAAAFAAAADSVDFSVVLEDLRIRSATPGRDAQGEVTIRARVDGQTFTGRGVDTDVVRASVEAWFHAVNKAEEARHLEARHLARHSDHWAV